jgi:lipoprotein-releasing system permease protein
VELAVWLGVGVGDDVIVMLADYRAARRWVGCRRMKRFVVSGVFSRPVTTSSTRVLAVVNLNDLQRLLRMGEGVTGVRLKLHDMDQAFDVGRALAVKLKGPYRVSDWTQDNANLFRALKMEKTVMAILLSLIIAMGAFNLVSVRR